MKTARCDEQNIAWALLALNAVSFAFLFVIQLVAAKSKAGNVPVPLGFNTASAS